MLIVTERLFFVYDKMDIFFMIGMCFRIFCLKQINIL